MIVKPFKIINIFLLTSIGFLITKQFCESKTDRFTIASITPDRAFDPQYEINTLSESEKTKIQNILDQPFTYIGYGAQAFIFKSSDDKYVLKLLKQRIYTTPVWHKLPIPFLDKYKKKLQLHRQDKLKRDFTSYKICYDDLPGLTGVVMIHLNPSHWIEKKIRIQDKLGIWHHLDADKIDFILQKKAELVHEKIDRLMKSHNIEEAKKATCSVLSLIQSRCLLGLKDRDPSIDTNCGFIGDLPIKIDIGRISYDASFKDPKIMAQEIYKITAPFEKWLDKNHPTLRDQFIENRNMITEQISTPSDNYK